jgi:hypothetical protein
MMIVSSSRLGRRYKAHPENAVRLESKEGEDDEHTVNVKTVEDPRFLARLVSMSYLVPEEMTGGSN